MEKNCSRVVTDDDIKRFRQQLLQYEMCNLRILNDYFLNDLKHMVEILDTQNLLSELKSRNVPMSQQNYPLMEKELGSSVLSECLIQDIMDVGRDAVLALWESLFVLQNDYQHPNLIGILAEFSQTGPTLVSLIQLDKYGHQLFQLNETYDCHKKNLQEMTKNLEEHKAPGLVGPRLSGSISSCYLDLIVVSTQQFRNRSQHEIIETGGRHEHYLRKAHSALERISPNRLFRWCHRSGCIPHAVMVSGVPGVGKTTLMQKFVFDWVNKKHYQRFSFIFFFKFRELNKYDKVSLDEMILEQYPYLWSQLDIILQDPEKLLFIFDGLDESNHNIDFASEKTSSNTKEQVNIGIIVVSLVRQSLLKGCSILLTSRPTKMASVDISVFQRFSEIMGFFPKERKLYFEHFFHDQILSAKAFQYVRENDMLYTFCYIPSYCWIVCKVLSMCFKASSIISDQQILSLPKTVTQLFVSYVANTLLNHCIDTECPVEVMKSTGKMAEYGIMNHILTFDRKDFELFQVDITSKLLSSFIIETYQNKSHTATFSFLHLTIQEFFSALHHYLIFSEIDLQLSLDKARFDDGRGEMFIRFLCGLSDGITISLLKPYLRDKTSASEQVIRWLSQEIATKWGPKTDPREKMNLLTYLFESRNKPLVYSTIGPHGQLDFSEFHLTPVDCTVLAFILDSCRDTNCLNLDRCFIQSEGLERLTTILHTVQKLRLSNNDLKDSDMQLIYQVLTHPTSKLQKLSLRNNSLTSTACSLLAVALSMNLSLTELDLSRNNLAGPDIHNLMTTLSSPTCTISHLFLQQIKLTDEYAHLLTSLSKNPNLRHLDLSHNFLTDASAEHIQQLILSSQTLKEIRIEVNEFSKEKEGFLQQLQELQPGLSIVV
ncbi:NACHT, LRR and PYD domains-containing protein 3-like [Bufo bufo]|uniref:NACHT, LRR and PYD domains-containing protein 3-like n=1 Tax=Bufo bufo TaxID=8384 RepID=UPI001ABDAA16|nr:NACHT, LRR and PYD domains-containing protein 3-like [Bufo bufo]